MVPPKRSCDFVVSNRIHRWYSFSTLNREGLYRYPGTSLHTSVFCPGRAEDEGCLSVRDTRTGLPCKNISTFVIYRNRESTFENFAHVSIIEVLEYEVIFSLSVSYTCGPTEITSPSDSDWLRISLGFVWS